MKISAAGAATSVDGTLDLAGDFEIGEVAESTTTTPGETKTFTAMYSAVGGPVTVAHWSFFIAGDESAFIVDFPKL